MSKWRLGLLEKGKTERFFIWIIDEIDICQPINFISSISISGLAINLAEQKQTR